MMQSSHSFSSQILKIFLPVSMVILLVCIVVSLVYFLRIRQIVFSGTDEIIRKTSEAMQHDLSRQAKRDASLLVKERAGNIGAKLKDLGGNLCEIDRLVCWASEKTERMDPARIPLATEIPDHSKTLQLHMTTPDGTRTVFQGKKIPDWRVLEPLFAAHRAQNPEIQAIYFASADGYTIDYDDIGRFKRGSFDGRMRPWYKNAAGGGSFAISGPYEDVYHRGMTLTISFPCRDKDGRLLGVAGIDYNVKEIYFPIQKLVPGDQHYFLLLDRSGNFLAGPEDTRDPAVLTDLLGPVAGRIVRLDSGSTDHASKREGDIYISWCRIDPVGWKLVLMLPKTRVIINADHAVNRLLQLGRRNAANTDDNIRSVAGYLILVFLCAILLLVVVSFRLAAYLGKPIHDLNESLKEMRRSGKFEADLQRGDELGTLNRTLHDLFSDWEEDLEQLRKNQKK